jgi:thiamine-phosphate pyrophosphorylase
MIAMSDEARMPDPMTVVPRLRAGSAFIFRHYGAPDRCALAAQLAPLCRRYSVKLLIANDARLAHAVHADGLHLSESALRQNRRHWRLWRRPHWFITGAAHSPAALVQAARMRIDAALLAPVFPTASHPERTHIGILRFALWAKNSPLPVYALGGMSPMSVRRLKGCRISGIAGIGGFLGT